MINPYDQPTEAYQPNQNQAQAPGDAGSHMAPAPGTPGGYANSPQGGPSYPPRRRRSGAIWALVILLLIVFGVGLFSGWAYGRSTTTASPSNASSSTSQLQPNSNPTVTVPPLSGNNIQAVQEAVIQKVEPSVVQVNVQLPNGAGIGSGVIIDKRGYIVTNNHVVDGAQAIQVVLFDGRSLPAQLVGTDPLDDLAIIKINPPANIVTATIGDSSKVKVGEDVLAIGNPLGNTQTVTNGIVSALNRTVIEGQGSSAVIPDAIQTDAPINPGNSGGALVDLQGNLIGIPTVEAIDPEFNTPANGVGFAIPSNRVSFIASQIIQTGHVTHTGRAALGISAESVDPFLAAQDNLSVDHGVLITNVQSGGPAAQAGLQPGDVIVQINNAQVTDLSTLEDVLASYSPGQTVSVHVYRGNQQLTVNVRLGELTVP